MIIRHFRRASFALAVAAALLALAAPSRAGGTTTVDTFSDGANQGGWLYFDFPAYVPTGGNPDAYIGTSVSSKLPQVVTSGPSVFTGNFRLRNVKSLGIDLATLSTALPQARPVTFMITSNSCSVFVVGPQLAPTPADGWMSFDVSFDPLSPTLPAGWQAFGQCANPDAAWNTVIQNVTQVGFFWGDVLAYSSYSLDQWVLGADNARLTEQNPWLDLGGASVGASVKPKLLGSGSLVAGTEARIDLFNGPPNGLALVMLASPTGAPMPALGGTLHALPTLVAVGTVLDGLGRLSVASTMPPAPAGTELTLQIACKPQGASPGLLLSNGVRGTIP